MTDYALAALDAANGKDSCGIGTVVIDNATICIRSHNHTKQWQTVLQTTARRITWMKGSSCVKESKS